MDWKEAIKVIAKEDVWDPSKLKRVTLVGASSSFKYELYGWVDHEDSSSVDPVSLELPKLDIPHRRHIISTLRDFAGGKATCVWMSPTLPWDLNLPMTTPLPSVPGFLQLFVICVGQPPLLLTLCDDAQDLAALQQLTKDTTSLLHWSLLDFCTLDISILSCALTHSEFSVASLTTAVREKLGILCRFFRSPLRLDPEMYGTLRVATRAQTGATFVPCFLENPRTDKVWVFLMEEKWRNAVSLLIEHAHKEQRVTVGWEPDASFSLKVVSLEVAKRMSCAQSCACLAADETTRQCIKRLKEHFFENSKLTLQMNIVNNVQEPSSQGFYINPQGETLSILIVGNTGSGKSFTANSILGDKLFTPYQSFSPVLTDTCRLEERVRFGVNIQVCKFPSHLLETWTNQEEDSAILMQLLTTMHPGPDVILYVIKIERYTENKHDAYLRLKCLLGEHVTDHMIVVFSHGNRSKRNDISDLLDSAPPNLRQVLKECGHRCVVIDNTARNPEPRVQELVMAARTLKSQNAGRPYTCHKHPAAGQSVKDTFASRAIAKTSVQNLVKKLQELREQVRDMILQSEEKKKARMQQTVQTMKQNEKGATMLEEQATHTRRDGADLEQLVQAIEDLETKLQRTTKGALIQEEQARSLYENLSHFKQKVQCMLAQERGLHTIGSTVVSGREVQTMGSVADHEQETQYLWPRIDTERKRDSGFKSSSDDET